MCGFYCIAFTDPMIAGKTLLEYANLFSLNDYQKNHKVIYKPWLKLKKKTDKTRNYFLEKIRNNDLMSEKHKKCLAF